VSAITLAEAQALARLGARVVSEWWDEGELDGGWVEELAAECGVTRDVANRALRVSGEPAPPERPVSVKCPKCGTETIDLMAALTNSLAKQAAPPEPRRCKKCGGAGTLDCDDPQCGDSTWDHNCTAGLKCRECDGKGFIVEAAPPEPPGAREALLEVLADMRRAANSPLDGQEGAQRVRRTLRSWVAEFDAALSRSLAGGER